MRNFTQNYAEISYLLIIMNLTIAEIKKKIVPILKRNDIKHAAIFVSFARGEATKKSDIDILIEYKNDDDKSLFDLAHLKVSLEDKIGKEVDLVEYETIHPRLKKQILQEQMIIL